MPDSAIDRKAIRRKEKSVALADIHRREVITGLMSTLAGREWVWDLLGQCHIFHTSFSPDPHQAAFNEGERNIGLRLLTDVLTACPDQYLQAQRESNVRSATDEQRSSSIADGGDLGSNPSDLATNPYTLDDSDPISDPPAYRHPGAV